MDYRSRSRRYCHWRPYRLPPAPRLDSLSCSVRCRKPAHRAEHAQRDAYRQERVGFRGGTAIRTVKRPHWSRRPAGAGANAVVRHRLLGACRITYVLRANHRESPCGRGAEGTPHGARPSEKGWDRSDCRCKAGCLELSRSITAPLRFVTEPLQFLYRSFTASLRPVTPYYAFYYASVPANPEIRLASVTTNNQRPNLPPANPPIPSLDHREVGMGVSRLALDPTSLRRRAGVERNSGKEPWTTPLR